MTFVLVVSLFSLLVLVLIILRMLAFALVYFFVLGLALSSSWCDLCPNGDAGLFARSGADPRPDAGLRPSVFLRPGFGMLMFLLNKKSSVDFFAFVRVQRLRATFFAKSLVLLISQH